MNSWFYVQQNVSKLEYILNKNLHLLKIFSNRQKEKKVNVKLPTLNVNSLRRKQRENNKNYGVQYA
jgi:hypothetical protein